MPPVVGLIAGSIAAGLVTGGLAVAGLALTGAALTVVSFGITAVVSGLVTKALSGKYNTEDLGGLVRMARDPAAPREYVYGMIRTGGSLAYLESTGTNNDTLWLVNAYADHEIDSFQGFFVNDELVAFSGNNATTAPYNGFLSRYVKTGTAAQTVETNLDAVSSNWTSNHRLRGTAYVVWKLLFDPDVWPTGLPNLSVIVKGRKVYDPRKDSTEGGSGSHRQNDSSTWEWSENPVLCLLDYLRDDYVGPNFPWSAFEASNIIAAANICDETVSVVGGGLISRYTVNGLVNSEMRHEEVIDVFTRSMAGTLSYSGGVFRFHPGAYDSPSVSFDEDDILSVDFTPAPTRRDLTNAVKGLFVPPGPDNDYQPADYPVQSNATYETQDGGERFLTTLDLPLTQDHREAQRIAKIALESARQGGVATIRANLKGLGVRVWDTVQLTHGNFGWSNKVFRVTGWKLNPPSDDNSDNQGFTVDLTLKEEAASIYSWTAASDEQTYDPPAGNVSTVTLDLSAPTGLTAVAATFSGSDGSKQPAIKVTWNTPPVWVIGVQVELSPDNGTSWYPYGIVPPNSGDGAIITGLTKGTTYKVRIAHVVGGFANVGTFGATAVSGSITITDTTIAKSIVGQGDLAVLDKVDTAQIYNNAVTDNELVTSSSIPLSTSSINTLIDLDVTAPAGYDVYVQFFGRVTGTSFGAKTDHTIDVRRTDVGPTTIVATTGISRLFDDTSSVLFSVPMLDTSISVADPTYTLRMSCLQNTGTRTVTGLMALVLVIKR